MMEIFDMKKTEKEVFRLAIFEDGIWEIYLGLFFALMSIYPITRAALGPGLNALVFVGFSLILLALALTAKKRITQPRSGLVRFSPRINKKIKTANIITLGLVVAALIMWILTVNSLIVEPIWSFLPQWLSDFDIDLIFALVMTGFFWVIAYTTGTARFYLHGLLIGAGNFSSTVLLVYYNVEFGWPIALAGLVISLIGILVLVKFLQEHPHPSQEGQHGR